VVPSLVESQGPLEPERSLAVRQEQLAEPSLVIRKTNKGDTVTNARAEIPASAGNLYRAEMRLRRNGGRLCMFR